MGFVDKFITKYIMRGMVMAVVGGFLATIGLLFGLVVGTKCLEMVGIGESFIETVPESTVQSGTLQLIGLMMAGVLFTFSNSLLGQLPLVGSFAGFTSSISEAVFEIGKATIFVAVPLTIGLIVSTVIITDWMYLEGSISREIRDTTLLSTISVFPMVMFYQIGVEKLTM